MERLNFRIGNAKLNSKTVTFSLPAGWSCPFAKECHSRANKTTGKIIDGKHCQFRCYAAAEERFTIVRKSRWDNLNTIRRLKRDTAIANAIHASLPDFPYVRPHTSGDFFSEAYFVAWLNVAANNPDRLFYAYTKALPFLVKYQDSIPNNFKFTASFGGTHDHLIDEHGLRYAKVVFSEDEAAELGLPIDHDDSHARGDGNFALLLHGHQPKGTPAAQAWYKIMRSVGGYSRNKTPKTLPNRGEGLKNLVRKK